MFPAPVKPIVPVEELSKLDIRVGTILSAIGVPGSTRLVCLKVDFGDHDRTILVGMKDERADPKSIEGLQTLFVINIPPRKMGELESQGMLLDIGYKDGITPMLALPEEFVPNGARVG